MNTLFSKIAFALGVGTLLLSSQASAETITKDPITAQVTVKARTIFDVMSNLKPLTFDLDDRDSWVGEYDMGTIDIRVRDNNAYKVTLSSDTIENDMKFYLKNATGQKLQVWLWGSHQANGTPGTQAVGVLGEEAKWFQLNALQNNMSLLEVGTTENATSEEINYEMGLVFSSSVSLPAGEADAENSMIGHYTGQLQFTFQHTGT